MEPVPSRILVDKERVTHKGKPHFRLYLWDPATGVTISVLSPIDPKERIITKEGLYNAI